MFVNGGAGGRGRELSDIVGDLAEFAHERPDHEDHHQGDEADIQKQPLIAFENLEILIFSH